MIVSRCPRRWPTALLLASSLLMAAPVWAEAPPSLATQTQSGYQLPSAALKAIVDAPRAPSLFLSPRRDLAVQMGTPSLPSIAQVAQPELKLAGLRIHPRTYSESRFSFGNSLGLKSVADASERPIKGLPQDLAVASLAWSPDQRFLAFNHVDAANGGNELWLVDVASATARRLLGGLNTVLGDGYQWLPDSSGLLVQLQPEGRTPPPESTVPTGPAIQQTGATGEVRAIRTYQDLLANENDAARFDHYATVQPALVSLGGQVQRIAQPGIYLGLSLSPDGKYLLSQRVQRPYSYLVPVSGFPRLIEVLDRSGKLVHRLASLPLVEGLPTGNDAVPTGPRSVSWRGDADATLVWAEAQDSGDPAREATIRDAVLSLPAPFDGKPATLAQLGSRYGGIRWGRGDVAILGERWFKTRWSKTWLIAPDQPGSEPKLLDDRSSQDRYNDPGTPMLAIGANGRALLQFAEDGESIFLAGAGASAEGDRPFVDRYNLASGQKQRIFQSPAEGSYSAPVAVLDDRGQKLVVTRETPDVPSNIFVLDQAKGTELKLTDVRHPVPSLAGVRKEQIRYPRADGVQLTAELLLPPGYDPKKDGPRPVLMWAYPGEFKSADAASQVSGSKYRFNTPSYWGPQAMLAKGWVVLNDPSMPIIGEGDAEPNDTYVEQLVASAEAAVAELEKRGVGERGRIAVGGHSYGAFMTANLLAHTRLFAAGIARSGAYNRTLTPFGFQAEERNYWQAQDTYLKMSPFNHADRIKDPILFIHGEQDNNSGTFPIQSERMFAAIKGLGGNARLVMLPNESHGYRARESILHMLAETERWLEQHVGKVEAKDGGKRR